MDLRDLEYFRVVVRHGHIGRAAEELGLTQPALSKSVARLESSVGARLLERTPRGVVLTQVGAALIARATHIRSAVDGALREAHDLSSGASGQLRIGTGPSAGEHILPSVCAKLLRGSPKLYIQVVVGLSDVLLAALARGELDLVFGSFPEPRIAGMIYESLGEDVLTVFTRKRHWLTRAPRIVLPDLAGVRWALPNASVTSRRTLQQVLQVHRLPRAGCGARIKLYSSFACCGVSIRLGRLSTDRRIAGVRRDARTGTPRRRAAADQAIARRHLET